MMSARFVGPVDEGSGVYERETPLRKGASAHFGRGTEVEKACRKVVTLDP